MWDKLKFGQSIRSNNWWVIIIDLSVSVYFSVFLSVSVNGSEYVFAFVYVSVWYNSPNRGPKRCTNVSVRNCLILYISQSTCLSVSLNHKCPYHCLPKTLSQSMSLYLFQSLSQCRLKHWDYLLKVFFFFSQIVWLICKISVLKLLRTPNWFSLVISRLILFNNLNICIMWESFHSNFPINFGETVYH